MAAGSNVVSFPRTTEPARPSQGDDYEGPDLSAKKRQFENAISAKTAENQEAAEADRYYHAVQWTDAELKILKDRNQPPVTFNRIKRKINTVVGILEKMRQDPKAYPRNPNQSAEDGAELATNTLRYALGWEWNDRSASSARRCATRGVSGLELVLTQGDRGDPEIELDEVDQRDFFYDPRSGKHDFTDARFLGTSRWVDLDDAQSTFPDSSEELAAFVDRGYIDPERGDDRHRVAWLNKEEKQVRIVDHWYLKGRDWHYCIYCGEHILEAGPSPFKDEKGRSFSKFVMWSCEVDHDNDRYGFFRDLKGPQDEINHRRSKALHALNSRQVLAEDGAVDDVEKARKELARNDGWVVVNGSLDKIQLQDPARQQVVQGNLEMLAEAKSEIDNYGPNPGLIGTEVDASSGRAIQLLQAAGIAELGTFMLAFKHWKLRVYRAVWNAVQQLWTSERWIRVNDDEGMAQFIQVNGWQLDPNTGHPQVINQLAALDVDIIIEEGPDTINTMADTFDTLLAIGKQGGQVPPEVIIELSGLPSSTKKRVMGHMQQGKVNPQEQEAIQLRMAQEAAKLEEIKSKVVLNQANAQKAMADAQTPPESGQQIDTQADLAKARLDLAKAMEIEQRVAAPPQDTPEPGLFALNQAKAMRDAAGAERERAAATKDAVRTDNLMRYGAEEPAKIKPPGEGQ